MTREELGTNQEYMWQALSGEQSMTLTLAVEMLLRCHLSPNQNPYQNDDSSGRLATRFLKDNPSVERGRLRRGVLRRRQVLTKAVVVQAAGQAICSYRSS